MLVVVDSGMGNIGSVLNMLKRLGMRAVLASAPDAIRSASALILPGVGAFGAGMRALKDRDLIEPLRDAVLRGGTPILGICLGMQLFTDGSEEDADAGLGWVPGRTVRFDTTRKDAPPTVPHMGWNIVDPVRPNAILHGMESPRFYFVHSYHVRTDDPAMVVADTTHGYRFPAIIQRDNIHGVQFHPEKSHRFGLTVLKNFVGLSGAACVPSAGDPDTVGSRASAVQDRSIRAADICRGSD